MLVNGLTGGSNPKPNFSDVFFFHTLLSKIKEKSLPYITENSTPGLPNIKKILK